MVVIAAAAAVVVAGGTLLGLTVTGGRAHATGPILARPTSYQVVYRVTAQNGTQSWEVLTVHRPFDSSDIVYSRDPAVASSTPTSATWFDVDGLYTLDGSGIVRHVAGRQPGPSGSDQALGVELDGLVARKQARDLGRSMTVAGRRCRVFRFLEPPVGPIKVVTGPDHDDLCIDGDGLVLREDWVLKGRSAYGRVAVRVHTGPVSDPLSAAGAKPLPGNGAIPTATPGADPHPPIAPPPAPAGFQAARTDLFTLPSSNGGGLQARSTVWAFTRGGDVITVEAGFERGGQFPWADQPTPTTTVTLPGLGKATTALRSDGPEVRVLLGSGRWVRVRGTVPLPELVSYARRLTAAR
jgi:hypothetical protein